jgi:hypothetical protein
MVVHARRENEYRRPHYQEPATMRGDDPDFWDFNDDLYNAIRAAELAAEGAALRARAWAAMWHQAALVVLGISLVLGIAMLEAPPLRPWSGQAQWMFVLGLLCYLAIVAIAFWSRPKPAGPELHEIRKIRHQIAALYTRLQQAPGRSPNTVLLQKVAEGVTLLDQQLIPALCELIEKRDTLRRVLRRYERGQIRAPSSEMLAHLQGVLARYEVGIDECLQHAADAYGRLITLLQLGDDDDVANRARAWADDLKRLHDAMLEVLRGADPSAHDDATPEPRDPEPPDPVAREQEPDDIAEDVPVADGAPAGQSGLSVAGFSHLVEEALRSVRDRTRLVDCELIDYLPNTIAAVLREQRGGREGEATRLEQAGALQHVLIGAVDRLLPSGEMPGSGIFAMRRYHVLHGQYIEGRPPRQIMHQHAIAEATYHRDRRRAIRVLTIEVIEQEALHAQHRANGHEPH